MKTMEQVSMDKLRGGFYSPQALVSVCLDRLRELLAGQQTGWRLLEPSAGDGAFVRGLENDSLRDHVGKVVAVELVPREAALCDRAGDSASFPVDVRQGSFLDPDLVSEGSFDAAIGNPPFVRFQFVSDVERSYANRVAESMGITLKGVSNLWIPMLLCALNKLRESGAFAFIIPAECLTGISASAVRRWLLKNCSDVRIDLFAPGSFPGVLQEVVVLSGRRTSASGDSRLTVREYNDGERIWYHEANPESPTWTRYLLTPVQLGALERLCSSPSTGIVGRYARFGVATVTGANDYFSVDEGLIDQYDLGNWAIPLLPRIRNAEGLVFSAEDHESIFKNGARASLLDFSRGDNPLLQPGASKYISEGEVQGLHERYKCRIRSPWYCVPVVPAGDLLLSKRSHFYPRVVVNEAAAITTDTIYQGKMVAGNKALARAFAASFHNSLTLLTAEIEGRSFGGGVLELVPSEVARLRVIVHAAMADEIPRLDAICRSSSGDVVEELIRETDKCLARLVPEIDNSALDSLSDARIELQKRRLDRNRAG